MTYESKNYGRVWCAEYCEKGVQAMPGSPYIRMGHVCMLLCVWSLARHQQQCHGRMCCPGGGVSSRVTLTSDTVNSCASLPLSAFKSSPDLLSLLCDVTGKDGSSGAGGMHVKQGPNLRPFCQSFRKKSTATAGKPTCHVLTACVCVKTCI